MITSIYARKGGMGKTNLSFGLMKELENYFYASNDYDGSMVYLDKFPNKSKYIKDKRELKEVYDRDTNIIYDAGGFNSDITYEMLKKSDLIIVPSIVEKIPLISALRLLNEIKNDKSINAKIIVALTRCEIPKKDESIFSDLMNNWFKGVADEIVFLRKTKFFEKIIESNISFDEYIENNPRYRNSAFFDEWNNFIEVYNRYTKKD
ncbi:hypothetical protein CRV00_11965 [Malaciobacter molluscorum]|uniref:hypothetical protein n=1 Tax=Malaciobacter molluscorum TaxID=1032072 RepID=UPI00100A5130|nr:hypothetical protein [Malaciobacter molluscorum]RXJ92857.1 hypothetical protein CRV00_11965 [Malaciobacter molluscorum]